MGDLKTIAEEDGYGIDFIVPSGTVELDSYGEVSLRDFQHAESPDGRYNVCIIEDQAAVLLFEDGEFLYKKNLPEWSRDKPVVANNGTIVVPAYTEGGYQDGDHILKAWDLKGTEIFDKELRSSTHQITITSDGRFAAVHTDEDFSIYFIDLEQGQVLSRYTDQIPGIEVGGKNLQVWDIEFVTGDSTPLLALYETEDASANLNKPVSRDAISEDVPIVDIDGNIVQYGRPDISKHPDHYELTDEAEERLGGADSTEESSDDGSKSPQKGGEQSEAKNEDSGEDRTNAKLRSHIGVIESWRPSSQENIDPDIEEEPKKELLETLRTLRDDLNRVPKPTDLPEDCEYTRHDFYEKFGSWDEALEVIGINKEQVLLDDLEQVANKVGRVPNSADIQEHGAYAYPTYTKHLGSLSTALEQSDVKLGTEEGATDTATLPRSTQIDDIKRRVNGVGSSTICALNQAGYTTLGELHDAQPEDITTCNGIGRTKALRLIRFATEHVSSSATTTRQSADRHPPAERSGISPSNTSVKIQPSALETSWETITNNERIDEQFLIQVTDVGRQEDHQKSAQLIVQDKNGHELKVNIWSKHDDDWKFKKGRWYALENGLGKVWKSSDGTTRKKLSSTKDLNVIDLGSDFDPNAMSIGSTSKGASETQQPEATNNEDAPERTSDSTSADENSPTTANDVDSKGDDSPEADDDGILGDIVSDFDVS